ncbi:hypothetical protein [Aeromicrobium sp. 179-A 4D2 NHS]|uniref:hypothetical protein n=1 Tax=Aeromicrobium sp. 179-A 4D2 NHS TaxID=3142375 RepID=UPI0039A29254
MTVMGVEQATGTPVGSLMNPVLRDALAFRNECLTLGSPLLDWGFVVRTMEGAVADGAYAGVATDTQIACALAVLRRAIEFGSNL